MANAVTSPRMISQGLADVTSAAMREWELEQARPVIRSMTPTEKDRFYGTKKASISSYVPRQYDPETEEAMRGGLGQAPLIMAGMTNPGLLLPVVAGVNARHSVIEAEQGNTLAALGYGAVAAASMLGTAAAWGSASPLSAEAAAAKTGARAGASAGQGSLERVVTALERRPGEAGFASAGTRSNSSTLKGFGKVPEDIMAAAAKNKPLTLAEVGVPEALEGGTYGYASWAKYRTMFTKEVAQLKGMLKDRGVIYKDDQLVNQVQRVDAFLRHMPEFDPISRAVKSFTEGYEALPSLQRAVIRKQVNAGRMSGKYAAGLYEKHGLLPGAGNGRSNLGTAAKNLGTFVKNTIKSATGVTGGIVNEVVNQIPVEIGSYLSPNASRFVRWGVAAAPVSAIGAVAYAKNRHNAQAKKEEEAYAKAEAEALVEKEQTKRSEAAQADAYAENVRRASLVEQGKAMARNWKSYHGQKGSPVNDGR